MEKTLGSIKCQKCRHILLDELKLPKNNIPECASQKCNSYNLQTFIYLQDEKLPDWIKSKVEEEEWTKGKLHCVCGCKVGSFDFISGRKCECGSTILPPVHFITSQVDRPIATNISLGNKSCI